MPPLPLPPLPLLGGEAPPGALVAQPPNQETVVAQPPAA